MRPIKKSQPGETVSYMNSQGRTVQQVVEENYDRYGDAKMPMVGDIGKYCSYCESYREVDSLDVEHLAARSTGGSETSWNNFLLSCKICNSCKGNREITENYHWPHKNNTFRSFIYDHTGRVKVNPEIPAVSQTKAMNLMELVHLERCANTDNVPSSKDFRWSERYEIWNMAMRYKELYLADKINENDVIECAKVRGHWSVWYTVFAGVDTILHRLITDFPGTCAECFDPNNHYVPIDRNAGCEDPI